MNNFNHIHAWYFKHFKNIICNFKPSKVRQFIFDFFAFRYEPDEPRIVVSTTIPKSDIVAFINNREEYECIYLGADEENVQVVTEEPTDLFYEYMERINEQYN